MLFRSPIKTEEDFAATLLSGLQFGSSKKPAVTKKTGKKVPKSSTTDDNEDEGGETLA